MNATIKENMLAVYNNHLPEKTPVGIYSRYLSRGSVEREIRNMGMGIIDYYPVVSFLAPPWHVYPGFISEVRNVEFDIKYYWTNGKMIERRLYNTPVGTIYQDVTQGIGAGSEDVIKYYITDIEDYKVMQYIVDHTVFKRNESSLKSRIENLGQDGVVLGRVDRCPYQKLLIELAGAEQFLIDLHTDPEPVWELMEAMDKRMDEAFDMISDSSADVIWQPDNITSDMTPPNNFEKYCLPFYKKHSSQVKQAGKPYIIHMDGKIFALKDFINQAGFDGIESMSFPQIGGDLTYTQARDLFPGKVILPNFPSNLCKSGEEEITVFIDKLLQEVESGVPFMLQISEDIPEEQWQRVFPIIMSKFIIK